MLGVIVFLRVAFEGALSSKVLESGGTTEKSFEDNDLFGEEPLDPAGDESEATLTVKERVVVSQHEFEKEGRTVGRLTSYLVPSGFSILFGTASWWFHLPIRELKVRRAGN